MLRDYLQAFKDVIFPRLCFCCEIKILQGFLCAECQERINFTQIFSCRACGRLTIHNKTGICAGCVDKELPYNQLVSAVAYAPPITELIHFFKYKNGSYLIDFFGPLLINHIKKTGFTAQNYDFITPVPIHPSKLKERGYNQSQLIAQTLANYFKKPLKNDIIFETKYHKSQTKFKNAQRGKNILGAFQVKKDLSGKKIILVDDIFTTGATVKACAQALKDNGAREILVITLVKT